ncbi:hypothetical protein COO60DRAFT_884906 [Scenedesmus sp. NREL 46B-D3]|nr:hypothetical protein COO60DRAFT_884906 [Scenedesmus sp. NREL 46B-D3]
MHVDMLYAGLVLLVGCDALQQQPLACCTYCLTSMALHAVLSHCHLPVAYSLSFPFTMIAGCGPYRPQPPPAWRLQVLADHATDTMRNLAGGKVLGNVLPHVGLVSKLLMHMLPALYCCWWQSLEDV